LRSGNIDRQIRGAIIPCPIFFFISWNLVISLLVAYINYRLTCILKVGHLGANLNLFKHPLNLPVGAKSTKHPNLVRMPTFFPLGREKKIMLGKAPINVQHNRKGWDRSMILRSGVANSTIKRIIHVQSEILVTIMSIWPSSEDNAI
jgi:hypothetical protein